jgi:hypothetical protein
MCDRLSRSLRLLLAEADRRCVRDNRTGIVQLVAAVSAGFFRNIPTEGIVVMAPKQMRQHPTTRRAVVVNLSATSRPMPAAAAARVAMMNPSCGTVRVFVCMLLLTQGFAPSERLGCKPYAYACSHLDLAATAAFLNALLS